MGLVENYSAYLMGDVNGDWDPAVAPFTPDSDLFFEDAVVASAPYMAAEAGTQIIVPIRLENLKRMEVGAFQFDIAFDPAVIESGTPAVSVTGTLSESLKVTSNYFTPGLLKVAIYGAVPVGGDGVYVNLEFRVIGSPGSASVVQISGFRLNGGTAVMAKAGQVVVK